MSAALFCRRVGRSWRPTHLVNAARRMQTGYVTPMDDPLDGVADWTSLQLRRQQEKDLIEFFSEYGSRQTRDTTWQPHHSLHRPASPRNLTLASLLAAGAHLGHSTSLLNPNFIPYAYGARAGITIIDLDHTVPLLRRATNLVRAVALRGGTVVFIGTRPHLRAAVERAAERMDEQGFHVGSRWLPGTLTNRLELFGQNVVKQTKVDPDLVVFLNPMQNMPAIRECAIHHIPTIGVVDSNVDPRIVMYPIPANDESQRTAEVIAGVLSIAGREGVELRKRQEAEKAERSQKDSQRSERARERAVPNREYHSVDI